MYAWIGAGGDSNAGAIDTPEGLLVIDTQQYPRLARRFRDALPAKTGRPLRAVINTHCHLDHTPGTWFSPTSPFWLAKTPWPRSRQVLGRDPASAGPSRITPPSSACCSAGTFRTGAGKRSGTKSFKGRISLPEYDTIVIAPPTETFADQFAYHLPHNTVRLRYFGPAHCDGDITVHLERSKVVFLGNLEFYGRFPWLGDCDLDGWISALERVLALEVAVVVPGHGAPTTLQEFARVGQMLWRARRRRTHHQGGMSEDAAVQEVSLPQYADIPRYGSGCDRHQIGISLSPPLI